LTAELEQRIAAAADLTLQGRHVRLVPLAQEHAGALHAIVQAEPELLRYMPIRVPDMATMQGYIEEAEAERAAGRALPFAITSAQDGAVLGTTRFYPIYANHKRAEIGWTFLRSSAHRTPVNTECKRLLLALGFEGLGFNRIELKTDARNAASRRAIARLGATEEGTHRRHMVLPDGHIRDTVWFSIIREEWPAVCERLDGLLRREFAPAP